jgi:hypothetical protein
MKQHVTVKDRLDEKALRLLKKGEEHWRLEYEQSLAETKRALKNGEVPSKLRCPPEASRDLDPAFLVLDRFDPGAFRCLSGRYVPSQYLWSSPDVVVELPLARRTVSRTHNPEGRITGLLELSTSLITEDTDVADEDGMRFRSSAALIQLALVPVPAGPGLFEACSRVMIDGTTLFAPRRFGPPEPWQGWAYSELNITLRATDGRTSGTAPYFHAELSSQFLRYDRRLLGDFRLPVSLSQPEDLVLIEIAADLTVAITTDANFSVDSVFTKRPGRIGIYIPELLSRFCPEID